MKRRGKKNKSPRSNQSRKTNNNTIKNPWIRVLTAALASSAVSIILILLYSLCLYMGWLDVLTVPTVNTILKALGAILAAYLTVKKVEERRWLFGGSAGAVFIILAFLIFSVLSESFTITKLLALDLGMGVLAGVLIGLMYGFMKKRQ